MRPEPPIFQCLSLPQSNKPLPDVGISELEPGLRVVLLLRQHAIEPDQAWAGVRDGRGFELAYANVRQWVSLIVA